jgi:integrase/recombinase XerD
MTAPLITIFVRHGSTEGKPCKYAGDEFSKRRDCRKHLRWSANGEQHRLKAGTRSWAEAEQVKRDLEDQLAGRKFEPTTDARDLQGSIEVFIKDKKVQAVTPGVIATYTLQLRRLREFCEASRVFTVQGISRELITGFCAMWELGEAAELSPVLL